MYWVAAFVLAALTAVVVSGLVGRASAAAAPYGSVRSVPVVVRPVAAGEVVRPADVSSRRVPAAFVPAGAVGRVGRVAVVPLGRGEVLLASKLAGAGEKGVAALLPDGAKALAVPVGPGMPPLERGNRVDVLASFEVADAPPGTEPTFPVAVNAVVLAVDPDTAVTLAVSPTESPRVAFAIAKATVTLALTHAS
jgi:Flp pilus assembly protein CpaB